jgi:hypothetical protein
MKQTTYRFRRREQSHRTDARQISNILNIQNSIHIRHHTKNFPATGSGKRPCCVLPQIEGLYIIRLDNKQASFRFSRPGRVRIKLPKERILPFCSLAISGALVCCELESGNLFALVGSSVLL